MKKRILSMLLVIVMVLSMVPVSALAAGELTITSTKGSAVIGKDKLKLQVTGGEVTDQFTWSAEGASVTLTPEDTLSCTLEGNEQGTATVKVTNRDGSKSGTKSFQIYLQPEELKIIDADTKETAVSELKVGQTLNLGFTCKNLDTIQGKSLKWAVADVTGTNVMTIDQRTGALEAKNAGTAKVTLAFNGGRAEQTFTVSPADPPAPKEITITPATAEMYPYRSLKLEADVEGVQWTSSDDTVATVSSDGEVKSLKTGSVTITAEKDGYKDATCVINIVPNAFRITDSDGNEVKQIKVGQTVDLQVRDLSNTAQSSFKWTSSNDSTATVDATGKLTGVTPGSATITATKGGCTVTCDVTVEKYLLTIKADGDKDSFYVGKTYQLAAYAGGTQVTDVTWESSNKDAVAIDNTGKMTVLAAGVGKTITVTATPDQSDLYAAATLDVKAQANALVITDESGNAVSAVNVNETVKLVARDGNGDIVTGVQWASSDTNKAAFISDGLLKGIRQSSAPVTITASKEGYTAGTAEISVVVKSFDIKNEKDETVTAVEMLEGATMQLKAVDGDGQALNVVWSSKDSRVTVDNTGLVAAKESTLREAVAIEAKQSGYETKTVMVTVTKAPVFTDVKLDGDDDRRDELAVGETRRLIALDADGLEVEGVKWKVANKFADLENDKLTGAQAGKVTVTAEKDGYAPKDLLVNVYVQPVTGFVIASELPVADENGYIPMEIGQELPLSIDNVQPSYASDATAIEWVPSNSDDADVAKVEDGTLIALTPGYVTLNARATNAATRSGDVIYQLKVHVLAEERIVLEEEVPEEVLAGKSVNLKASVVDAEGEPVAKTSVKWKMLSEEEGVRLRSDRLDTDSSMEYRHKIRLRAEAVGCEAEPLEVTVMVVPVTTGITLKVGEKKVNNEVFIVDLSDEVIAEAGIIVSATILPASSKQMVRWEISDPGNVCTEGQLDTDLLLVPASALKSGVVTVTAYAGDGNGVSATARIQFSKLGAGKLKDVPEKLRGGASLDLRKYLVQDENVDYKTFTWSIENNVLENGRKIASIGRNGKLTTKAVTEPHEIEVTVTGASGVSDTKTITLYPAAKSVKISCDELKAENYTVELSKEKSERTFKFEATIKPDVLQEENVWPLIWSSTNNDIATVDEDGQVVVKKAGKVRIDCMIADGSKIKGSVNLKVTSTANTVTVTPDGRTLASGKSLNMKAVIKTPTGRKAANQSVTWSITDEFGKATSAAIISATGRVTAYDVDRLTEVLVTATSKQDKTVFGSVVLTIKPNTTKTLHAIIGKDMISGSYAMNKGESEVVDAKWQRSGNGEMKVAEDCQFFSSNTNVATIDKDVGTLKAVGYGSSTITLRCVDPATQNICTSTFTVKVVKKVGFVTISAPTLRDLRSGKSVTLKATAWNDYANGIKADNQGFTWEVTENGEATNVATINSNGVLTAKTVAKEHTVVVKAISKEGGISATATFHIFPAENVKFYFTLNGEEYTGTLPVDLGTGLGGLTVRVYTAFADSKGNISEKNYKSADVTWSTSDKSVIRIVETGPQALKVGKATLTAKFKIGKTTYESKITAIVNRAMGSVKSIEQSSILVAGKSINLRAVPKNSNATNKNVLWSVEPGPDSDNVSINMYTGKLSAKKGIGGYTVTVTATPVDGSTPKSTTVEVFAATTKVEISDGTVVVNGTKVSATLSDGTMQFYAAAKPTEAYQTSFKWTSSDTSVAKVDGNGKVTIKKVGATTIKATAQDGTGKYAKFTLRVTND